MSKKGVTRLAAAAGWWLLLWGVAAPAAHGYNRTKTSFGVPTAWAQMPIAYYLGKAGSKDIDDGSDIEAIKRSFATWAAIDCANISFRLAGMLDAPKAAYEPNGPNQNHIYWVEPPEPWPFPSGTLAVTTVHFQPATGEIRDADLRFNGHDITWSTQTTPPTGADDIQNTATHEIGHILGLDHADAFQTDATMFGGSTDGEVGKRDLAQDDRDGACAIYPKTPIDGITFRMVQLDLHQTTCPTNKPLLPSGAVRMPPSAQTSNAPGATPAGNTPQPAPGPNSSRTSARGCHAAGGPGSFLFSALLVLLWLALRRRSNGHTS